MDRKLRADEPPAEAGQPLESEAGGDLSDAELVDEFKEQETLCRVKYDSAQTTPSLAVISVVSNLTEIDPLELEPLFESIDSEALDALFTATNSLVSRLTFQYYGYEITVATDDIIEVVTG